MTLHEAEDPEPDKVHGEPTIPVSPPLSLVKLTVPVGVVGLAEVSVTVAVHVDEPPTITVSGLHITIVDVV